MKKPTLFPASAAQRIRKAQSKVAGSAEVRPPSIYIDPEHDECWLPFHSQSVGIQTVLPYPIALCELQSETCHFDEQWPFLLAFVAD